MLLDQLKYLLEAFFTAPVKKKKIFFLSSRKIIIFLILIMPNVLLIAKLPSLFLNDGDNFEIKKHSSGF